MSELTRPQEEVLRFIATTSPSPTSREICDRFGYASTNSVYTHADALRAKGMLHPKDGRARARCFELTAKGWAYVESKLPEDDRICREFLRGDSVATIAAAHAYPYVGIEAVLRRKLASVKRAMEAEGV